MNNTIWIFLGVVALAAWVAWRALRTMGAGTSRRRLSPRARRVEELRRKIEEREALKAAQDRDKARADEQP